MKSFITCWFLTGIILVVSGRLGNAENYEEPTPTDFKKMFKEWDNFESIRKSHLKVYGMNYPPVLIPTIMHNDTCYTNNSTSPSLLTYRGTGADSVEYTAQHYDLTIEWIQEDPSEVAKFGQTQALINAIVSEKVDLGPFGMTPTPERMKIFDLTSPTFCEKFKIMVKWPEETSRLTLVARPFDSITWLLIASSFLVVIGMLSLSVYFRHGFWDSSTYSGRLIQIVSDKIMFVIGITTNHGQYISYISRFPLRIMLGLWLLMMIVIINAYTGVLTSLMAVPKLKPIPQSLQELAEMKEYKVTIQKNQILADAFLNASSGAYKVLGDTLRQNPELHFSKFPQAVENVLKYDAANVDAGIVINIRIGADMKSSGKCRLVSSPVFHTQSYSYILPKNSRYTKAIDRDQWRSMEAGLYDHSKRVYIPSIDKCNLNAYQNSRKIFKPIRLVELSSAFFVLGIGIGLSILIFLLERIVHFGREIRNARNIITI